jgi:hypothetical protein
MIKALRIVPHNVSYERVTRLNNYAETILYISTILSIAISLLGYLNLFNDLKNSLIGLNIILICLYAFYDNRGQYVFTKAEMRRRLDYLDNSFDTNFTGKKSQNYFTNDNLSPGLHKLSTNSFENCFHTQFIVSKMYSKSLWQTIIILILFIISAYIGNREVVRMFFELALPLILIQKLIKISFFTSRLENVLDGFKHLFNDLKTTPFENKTAEALKHVLDYETALSWASTPTSSKVFFKYKDQLAAEWEDIKREYQL